MWHMIIVGLVWGEEYREFLLVHNEVFIHIRGDISDQKRQEFFSALQALPFVKRATYITREKALDRMRSTRPNVLAVLEGASDLRQIPDMITVQMTSLQERALLDGFLLDSPWQRVIDPAMFVHETDDVLKSVLQVRVVYGVLVTMMVMLCTLAGLFVLCMMGIMKGDIYQLPLRIRNVRQGGGNGFVCALPFIVGCSIWGWLAAVGSWVLIVLFGWSLFPSVLRFSVSSVDWGYILFVIGVGEILVLPLVIGFIGWIVTCDARPRSSL
ncbi:hypothetical protein HYZ98_04645 [Candidatus Peregrinibacteria bacterium]|nr:hypothetical protein [Candidatus Peregrinibacteria bacterium]